MFNTPKKDSKYEWTNHVVEKMAYYRLSESLVKRVVRFPNRIEEGVAPKTTAVMISRVSTSRAKGKEGKKTEEIWVMYRPSADIARALSQSRPDLELLTRPKGKIIIISAWRYPGISPIGKKIPIPDEILQELDSLLN